MSDKKSPVDIVTFGCRLNAYEAEVMADHAKAAGLTDAVVFNTCAVTQEAVRQSMQAIRRHKRDNPNAKVIVTGCAAQIDPHQYADMGEVDAVIGNGEKMQAHSWRTIKGDNRSQDDIFGAEKVRVNDIMALRETADHMISAFHDRVRAFVQVQNGCDHRCTFCIIPYGRGNSRSVPIARVIDQIEKLLEGGVQEIVLTGVDITSYGPDLPGQPTLGVLVQSILKNVPQLRRLRLSSIDSIEMDEPLFEALKSEASLLPHVHLSLQHGDNLILKRMKRRHTRKDSIAFCHAMRAARPDLLFGADIIAGFPTETEAMFAQSVSLAEECDLSFLHVFPFSPRQGTPAAKMPQLDRQIVKSRAKRLRDKGQEQLVKTLNRFDGTVQSLLVEQAGKGHTDHFIPVTVDEGVLPGQVVQARLALGEKGLHARPVQ